MTSAAVRTAAAGPDRGHRDPDFLAMLAEVKVNLLGLYPTKEPWQVCLIGGSGTAAMEAMVASCVREGPVLLIANGYYSERFADILAIHDIPHEVLASGWLEPWDIAAIERRLDKGGFEAVLCAHHETTSGRLNPVAELGLLCQVYRCRLLVDAVSSFGCETLDLNGIDAICGTGNKCLHGLAGVSFVLLRAEFAERIAAIPRRTHYLHLPMYLSEKPPLTPPITAIAALSEALREMTAAGVSARQMVYQGRAKRIRNFMSGQGLVFAIEDAGMSCSLTVVAVPPGWNAAAWIEANRMAGYLLYECKGELRDRFFQVANMGELSGADLDGWERSVRSLLANR